MPRKAKDEISEDSAKEVVSKENLKSKVPTKKTTKKENTKKSTEKKSPVKKETNKKTTKVATKKAATKNDVKKETKSKEKNKQVAKKSTVKETPTKTRKTAKKEEPLATKKVAKKTSASKKETSKTTVAKKEISKKKTPQTKKVATSKKASTTIKHTTTRTRTKKAVTTSTSEYYDLPNHYEQTVVKILAQTPSILFVYWDISSNDRTRFMAKYGNDFFEKTSPFLQVINKTKNYQFEVEINDYANSWYLHIPDSDCEYEIILMRKNRNSQVILENNGNMTITTSNNLEAPNDHILFEKLGKTVFFQNVKTHGLQSKDISSFAFMHNMGRIYNIYDLYKEMYKNELNGDELGMKLPSSGFSSNFI